MKEGSIIRVNLAKLVLQLSGATAKVKSFLKKTVAQTVLGFSATASTSPSCNGIPCA